jgi:hypothetical protein
MAVTVKNNIKKFFAKAENAADMVLSGMAVDILRMSKQQVPVDKGQLQSSGILEKQGKLKYRIVYNKKYARFQHAGGDDKRRVRRYTYPGKKSHYLSDPADSVKSKQGTYLKKYMANPQ